jgi:hypothetical protein
MQSEQAKEKLWEFATQPLQLLVTHRKWQKLPETWNTWGLGFKPDIALAFQGAAILHFTGSKKPWSRSALKQYLPFWQTFNNTKPCFGRGVCLAARKTPANGVSTAPCQCAMSGILDTFCG